MPFNIFQNVLFHQVFHYFCSPNKKCVRLLEGQPKAVHGIPLKDFCLILFVLGNAQGISLPQTAQSL